jgi:hypothetical protein
MESYSGKASGFTPPHFQKIFIVAERSQDHIGITPSVPSLMAQAEIWTERLFLRAAEDRDLPYFQKWFSDPVAMKYW